MTYPPGPPSGPGFGGEPYGQGQQPEDPAWWGQPAQPDPTQLAQPAWPGEQPAWQQPAAQAAPAWQQPADQGAWPQQQPGWTGQQGYSQQPGYGAPPPQPPRSNTGLIVGIVIAVVAVLAVSVGAIVVVTHKGSSDQAAAATTTTVEATTTTETTTSRPPTTTTKSAPAGGRFSYTEYGKDWNFKLDAVALQADWVKGQDFDSCAPVEENGKLTGLGCQYASELVWKSENGGLMLTQFVLGMGDADKASAAEGQFDDKDLNLPAGSYISKFETGKWKDGSQGQFLVITFATADSSVDAATVEKYLRYRHGDTVAALIWR